MNNSLLVTGGAGFIGSNFIRYWLKNHPEDVIYNLDALTYAGNLESLKDLDTNKHIFVHGDINNPQIVNEFMSKVKMVVHFAAESHVDRSISHPEVFLQTNVMGTFQLLQSALAHKIERFHHISTDEVFGSLALEGNDKFTRNSPYNPHSPYSASKAGSDHLVRAFGDTYNLPYSITNCSNNYGPYHFPEKMIPKAITNLLMGKPIEVYGQGQHVRDWLFVEDHCAAIESIITNQKTLGKTYLVGGLTHHVSNLEIAQKITQLMGKDPQTNIKYVSDRPGHDERYSVDWSQINEDLGWQPSVTLEEGLQKTIDWYINNEWWWQPLLNKAQLNNRQSLQIERTA